MANNKHEHWRDFTTEEVNKIKDDKCVSCPYFIMRKAGVKPHVKSTRKMDYSNSYCNYLEYTGKIRDQRPDKCTHYKDNVKVSWEHRNYDTVYVLEKWEDKND